MNRILIILTAIAMIAIGAGAAWYLVSTHEGAKQAAEAMPQAPRDPAEGDAIYTNGTYGFSVVYPQAAQVEYGFDAGYHLGTSWRANALPDVPGTPLVAFIPYRIEQESAYPRYFNAMVRIGVSSDPDERARCEQAAEAQGEVALGERDINGTAWHAFSFESAGMMQYARGVSYRTLRDDVCVALEQVRTGSTYREEESAADIADETLDAEYEALGSIIESMTFAAP